MGEATYFYLLPQRCPAVMLKQFFQYLRQRYAMQWIVNLAVGRVFFSCCHTVACRLALALIAAASLTRAQPLSLPLTEEAFTHAC